MEFDDATSMYYTIFSPGLLDAYAAVVSEQKRFVYYTSADTAMKLLRNQELWFRNASVMNDYSEISYGLELCRKIFNGPEGDNFKQAVDDIIPGTMKKAGEQLSEWELDWQYETYIACVSIHNPEEDNHGRLSMWRAYGDTAIVLNNTPMARVSDLAAVYSVPVLYLSEENFANHLSIITNAILINRTYLQNLGQDTLLEYINNMLFQLAIATKHPGFEEENEWRIFYRPTESESPVMTKETVVLDSVPQNIYKLRLAHDPKNGIHCADIPSLLDRIIIGPTIFSYVSYCAFVSVLSNLGVKNAESKVLTSDIPIRQR